MANLTMEKDGVVIVTDYPPGSTEKEIRLLCNWAFALSFSDNFYSAEEIEGEGWIVIPRRME